MKQEVGQKIRFNSAHYKNIIGKIVEVASGDNHRYGKDYYIVEADATHPEIEIKRILIYEKNITEVLDKKIESNINIKCVRCNTLNEYITKGNQSNGSYICYSCR